MIIARNIGKTFGELRVLGGVDLHVARGGIFGLAGRSGAGKSTFLRCINGLESYDHGSLVVDGVEVRDLKEEELREFRKKVGMVFQNFSLLERLTVYENVALPMRCWRYKASSMDAKVRELVGLVGLTDKLRQKPRELSGGQKQRVAIARALCLEPDILLCDEATSALDPKTAQDILSLLDRINRDMGITIVMVSHQMSVLSSSCREMAILENGSVACNGPVERIFREQPAALRNLLGEHNVLPPADSRTVTIRIDEDAELAVRMAMELGIEVVLKGVNGNPRPLLRVAEGDYGRVSAYLDEHGLEWTMGGPCARPDPVVLDRFPYHKA